MGGDVAQRFLRDPVQAQRWLGSDGAEVSVRAAREHRAVRALELGAVAGQGREKARVPEHRGMQVVGKVTNVLRERARALLKGLEVLLQILADVQICPAAA